MKIISLIRLAICVSFLSLGCSPETSLPTSTLRIGLQSEPGTLNPIIATDYYASWIESYVNDSLVERDKDTLKIKPKLAERWEVSDDGLIHTFYLRKNIRWHDGVEFTTDDIVFAFEKIQDPKVMNAARLKAYYNDAGIENIKKIDDYTVQFISTKPYFLALSVCGTIPLIPKHIYDSDTPFNHHPANRKLMGVGAYKFKEWKTARKIVLERNEDYWGEKPEIKTIEFRFIQDDPTILHAMKKGELDMASLRPIQWVKQVSEKDYPFKKYKYLSPGYSYIGWNNKNPLFEDKRVRLAMTHLVDRKKILEKIQYGLGRIVSSPFFIESPQYNSNLKPYPYDPAKALKLLHEAGWKDHNGDGYLDKDGKKFEFTFMYPSSSTTSERIAPILKEDLERIGIEMSIEHLEWGAFIEKILKKEFEATSLGWSGGFEGDPYQVWHSSQAKDRGSNFVSFINPQADRLIEQARVELDEVKRNQLYHRFQEIIYQEQPYTFLFSSDSLTVVNERFDNVTIHAAGLDVLEWKIR